MKRIVTLVMTLIVGLTAIAAAEDYEPPMYGLYESTAAQYDVTDDGLKQVRPWANFRIGFDPEMPRSVMVLWDYDGNGLENETVETYRIYIDETEVVWRDSSGVFTAWYDVEEETWFLYMKLGREKHVVELRLLEDWRPEDTPNESTLPGTTL
jgi:hypothetical protein